MLNCAIRQFNEKENKRREEEILENEFKRKLMEKYAEDEKLEQFNAMRRRQKEIDLKKEVYYYKSYNLLIYFRLKNNGKKNLDNIIYRKLKKLMNLKDKEKKNLIREKLFKKKRKDLLQNMRNC